MAAASSNTGRLPNSYYYDGVLFTNATPLSALSAVKKMPLYPEDLLLISYPKSGEYECVNVGLGMMSIGVQPEPILCS